MTDREQAERYVALETGETVLETETVYVVWTASAEGLRGWCVPIREALNLYPLPKECGVHAHQRVLRSLEDS